MKKFLFYDAVTGVCVGDCTCAGLGELPAGWAAIESSADWAVSYVNLTDMSIHPRQDYTLDALPLPCELTVEGQSYQVTEQPVFNFPLPGEYRIYVNAGVQYLEKEFIYHVD